MSHIQRVHLDRAVTALRLGGVIAYPTEGVWGLGCDPWDKAAVMKILQLKRRPVEKGLIIVAADMLQLAPLLDGLKGAEMQQLQATWPGPNTWLLPDPDQLVPPWVKGKFATVAVRISAHPLVQALCREFGGPIVSTSANPGSRPPALNRLRVLTWFGGRCDYVLPGRLGGRQGPSTIRDLRSSTMLR